MDLSLMCELIAVGMGSGFLIWLLCLALGWAWSVINVAT